MVGTHQTTDTCCERQYYWSFVKKEMVAEEGLEPPTRGL